MTAPDTIAAVATASGRGGIGVIRVSGPAAGRIAVAIAGRLPSPRVATFAPFRDAAGRLLDEGIALFFPAPGSYTGEDVLELQGHGGPWVMRELLAACVAGGARLAEPGEFTRRAFLNGRMDLAQAEGVADLIDAASAEAARGAARSLSGEFSRRIHALVEGLTELRLHVEACIDFPEEQIDPADRRWQLDRAGTLAADLDDVLSKASQGAVLRDGLTVVLAGAPNVGKSSLLNRLADEEVAIVAPVPGTTRDTVRASLTLQGVPLHLVDTAGLRETGDVVERLGIERTWAALEGAGAVLVISDASQHPGGEDDLILSRLPAGLPVARIRNKIDLAGESASQEDREGAMRISLSAKTGEGVEALRAWLLAVAGWQPHGEGVYVARQRHLEALGQARRHLASAVSSQQVFELMAEELKLAQNALGAITGALSADDLLGRIFSHFCIGK